MSLLENVYSGTATFGRYYALFSAIIVTIISVIMLSIGLYFVIKPYTKYTATVTKIIPGGIEITYEDSTKDSKGTTKEGTIHISTSASNTYTVGQHIDIYVSSNGNISLTNLTMMGGILIGIAIIISLISWIWYWITTRSKIAATVEGVIGGVNLISNVM